MTLQSSVNKNIHIERLSCLRCRILNIALEMRTLFPISSLNGMCKMWFGSKSALCLPLMWRFAHFVNRKYALRNSVYNSIYSIYTQYIYIHNLYTYNCVDIKRHRTVVCIVTNLRITYLCTSSIFVMSKEVYKIANSLFFFKRLYIYTDISDISKFVLKWL